MTEFDLDIISSGLGIELPTRYVKLLVEYPFPEPDICFLSDPKMIVELTNEYRKGYGGAPPWPPSVIYIGDQDDACPIVLDLNSGVVVQTDHGNLKRKPLQSWPDIDSYIEDQEKIFGQDE